MVSIKVIIVVSNMLSIEVSIKVSNMVSIMVNNKVSIMVSIKVKIMVSIKVSVDFLCNNKKITGDLRQIPALRDFYFSFWLLP